MNCSTIVPYDILIDYYYKYGIDVCTLNQLLLYESTQSDSDLFFMFKLFKLGADDYNVTNDKHDCLSDSDDWINNAISAAKRGKMHIIKDMMNKYEFDDELYNELICIAAEKRYNSIVDELIAKTTNVDYSRLMRYAISSNNLDVAFRYLDKINDKSDIVKLAAISGNPDTLELITNDYSDVLYNTSLFCYTYTAMYFKDKYRVNPDVVNRCFRNAMASDSIDFVAFLIREYGHMITRDQIVNNLQLFKSKKIMYFLISVGKLDIVLLNNCN